MKKPTIPAVLLLALTLGACATAQKINYQNPNPSPTDANLSFTSSFETHTYFSVNEQPKEVCDDFKSIGYVLNADSIFLYDKPNKVIKLKMPTGKTIAVRGYHQYSDPGEKSSCFPPAQLFTPEANQSYEINMGFSPMKGTSNGVCFLMVNKVLGDGTKAPVNTEVLPYCGNKPKG